MTTIEHIGTQSELKAGLGRTVVYAYPDAKPLYKKKYVSAGVQTDIELVMGEQDGKGVIMAIDAPSSFTDEEVIKMVENSVETGKSGECTYCKEASNLISKIRNELSLGKSDITHKGKFIHGELGVGDASFQENTGETEIEQVQIARNTTEKMNRDSDNVDSELDNSFGIIPLRDAFITPKDLLRFLTE